jgi:Alpha-glutamyl/putrescinyl thymine pyrophosphorylase clade 3
VRRVARAADDGYEHDLVPGLRASADAERLADELAFGAARLVELERDPPGLYADVALADPEEAAWLAFLIAELSPLEGPEPFAAIERARTSWASGAVPDLEGVALGPRAVHDPPGQAATLTAYRAWAQRAGSQLAAFAGEATWSPERRFERAFERLALPGFGRAARLELLVLLGRLEVVALRPASLHLGEGADPVTAAAKRVFGIGDALNLRRRSAQLAEGAGVPVEALDLALFNWARAPEDRVTAGARVTGDPERRAAIGRALRLG